MRPSLEQILTHKHRELALRQANQPLSQLEQRVKPASAYRFEQALQDTAENDASPRFILEVKPASPSLGVLATNFNLDALLEHYHRYAAAISVLTDETFFQGSFDLLTQVKQCSPHPVLCKDFILTPYQVYEACLAGADAVLLIVKILDDVHLKQLHRLIQSLGMTPVVEIQNRLELERALQLHPSVLLINNRDLETFNIALDTTCELAPFIPEGILRISASGIQAREDIERLLPYCSNFLIGSVLMQTPLNRLDTKLRELAGR